MASDEDTRADAAEVTSPTQCELFRRVLLWACMTTRRKPSSHHVRRIGRREIADADAVIASIFEDSPRGLRHDTAPSCALDQECMEKDLEAIEYDAPYVPRQTRAEKRYADEGEQKLPEQDEKHRICLHSHLNGVLGMCSASVLGVRASRLEDKEVVLAILEGEMDKRINTILGVYSSAWRKRVSLIYSSASSRRTSRGCAILISV